MGLAVTLIVFITASLQYSVSAQCSDTTPPCNLVCHCQSGSQCSVTGCGTGSCERGYDGPTCQRVNVALGLKNPGNPQVLGYSSYLDDHHAALAFDGVQTRYFSTWSEQRPFLWVNLGSVQTVYALSVVTTAYDFQIYINSIASLVGATLCTSNNAAQTTDTKRYDVTCNQPLYAQYVWITRPGSDYKILAINEMEIYKCSDYWFGVQCDKPCNCQRKTESCNKITGACSSGCPAEYARPDCQVCIDGRYGSSCSSECGKCLNGVPCDKDTGHCDDGCKTGYNPPLCQVCTNGRYGPDCANVCGKCLLLNGIACHKDTGSCTNGCKTGYMPPLCKVCLDGRYGSDCTTCGNCKGGVACYKSTGNCPGGCKQGYAPFLCQVCIKGRYGSDCSTECGHCRYGPECNKESGICPYKNKCKDGYAPDVCQVCLDRRYGSDCSNVCGNCKGGAVCKKNDGECPGGCKDGYAPPLCKVCLGGRYGPDCDACGNCKDGAVCNKDNGYCTGGCNDGYAPPLCQVCIDGRYGSGCSSVCGNCKDGAECDKNNGYCTGGCKNGYTLPLCQVCQDGLFGLNCSQPCGHCIDKNCDETTGACPGSCVKGFAIPECTDCADGYYGENCLNECGHCFESTPCNKINGKCTTGCDPGFQSVLCNIECQNNTFGRDCLKDCHCANNSYCKMTSGECGEIGCASLFKGASCQESLIQEPPTNVPGGPGFGAGTIGGIVAAVLVIILVAGGLLFFIQRRRRMPTKRRPESDGSTNEGFEDLGESPRPKGSTSSNSPKEVTGAEYGNNLELQPLTLVHADELTGYVNNKITEKGAIEKEFEELPTDVGKSFSDATTGHNKPKCRYRGLLPYDDTRVVLDCIDGDPTTDFINASYIDGYSKPKQYIAAQGTTSANIEDFWRMVWQMQCGKIVMLTNLFEKGKTKVLQYWPTDKPAVYGDISIECAQTEHSFDYCVRTLNVKKGTHVRSLTQFHFIGWPDHNAPRDTAGIIQFREKVNTTPSKLNGPIVIHCSAGVGRTGTYIGYEYLIEKLKEEKEVDIFHTVIELRQQRVLMVQSKEQYGFLHKILRDAYLCDNSLMTSDQVINMDLESNEFNTRIDSEFQTLNFLCENLKSETTAEEKKEKESSDRIWLSSPAPGGSEFIRAKFLPLDSQTSQLISVVVPSDHQVTDFWRLVYERRCTALILLNQLKESEQYWPKQDSPYSVGCLTVSLAKENEISPCLKTRTFLVEDSRQNGLKTVNVKQFTFSSWKEGPNVLPVTDDLLTLKEHVAAWQRHHLSGNILLHCRDGSERSGLYAVSDFLLDRLKSEGSLNVLLTAKRLRGYGQEFIPTIEQYNFCYRVAKDYFKMFDTYANFD